MSAAGARPRHKKATKQKGKLYKRSNVNIGPDTLPYDFSAARSTTVDMQGSTITSPIKPITPGGSWRLHAAEQDREVTPIDLIKANQPVEEVPVMATSALVTTVMTVNDLEEQ